MSEQSVADSLVALARTEGEAVLKGVVKKATELGVANAITVASTSIAEAILRTENMMTALTQIVLVKNQMELLRLAEQQVFAISNPARRSLQQLAVNQIRHDLTALQTNFIGTYARSASSFPAAVEEYLRQKGSAARVAGKILGGAVGVRATYALMNAKLDEALANGEPPDKAFEIVWKTIASTAASTASGLSFAFDAFVNSGAADLRLRFLNLGQVSQYGDARLAHVLARTAVAAGALTLAFEFGYFVGGIANDTFGDQIGTGVDWAINAYSDMTSQGTLSRYPDEAASLAILINRIDPDFGVDETDAILAASAPSFRNFAELTRLHTALRKVFLPGPSSDTSADANVYFNSILGTLAALKARYPGQTFVLKTLTGKSSTELYALGQGNIAYRYALQELNPFVVLGDASLYDKFNTEAKAHELDLYDPDTGIGLTDKWIEDRAAFLVNVIAANIADTGQGKALRVDGIYSEPAYFLDKASGLSVQQLNTLDGNSIGPTYQFGAAGSDRLAGDKFADHLYGMSGNDVLQGKDGDDYLEGGQDNDILVGGADNDTLNGGAGLDTYIWNSTPGWFGWNWRLGSSNDGDDEITDADRKGRFLINGQGVKALLKQSDGTWATPDGKVTLSQTEGHWTLSMDGGGLDLGPDFSDGDYGIRRLASPTLIPRTKGGDLEPILLNGALQYDALGNVVVNPGIAHNGRDDTLYGSTGNDRIQGLGGSDVLIGQGGDDILEGGTGGDVVKGESGNDLVLGDDYLTVDAAFATGNSQNALGTQGNWLDGGSGDDILLGGAGRDVLSGGMDADLLIGGADDDLLMGDASLTSTRSDWSIGRETVIGDTERTYTKHYLNADVQDGVTSGGDDALYGGKGDDWAVGGGGDDLIDGGDDKDVLMGDAGNDVLLGGAGDDTLDGDSADTPTALQGDDWLDGGEGDDILIGGAGNDTIYGGAGRDTYFYNKGDGIDHIVDNDTGADKSIFVFGERVNKDDIKLHLGSLMLDLGDGDGVHIDNFDAMDPLGSQSVASFQFADGSSLGWEELLARGFDIDGTAGDDNQLVGTGVDDRLRGFGGNDLIYGLAGNDPLDGGAGSDGMAGALGDDIYIVRAGEAALVVRSRRWRDGDFACANGEWRIAA